MACSVDMLKDLPILEHRKSILRHIRDHRITCIHGETGCGKSTMVPQFILEHHERMKRRAFRAQKFVSGRDDVNIVVTQPRRMAAISLAKRVARQRGEEVGDVVGYSIGGDSNKSDNTCICYVTTGLLLQVLSNNPESFGRYSHIILDEIHERQIDCDLLSLIVKLLASDPEYAGVKIIIMSATLEGELFSRYFNTKMKDRTNYSFTDKEDADIVDVIFVGAQHYRVSEVYLEDFLIHDEYKAALGGDGLRAASVACVKFNRQIPLRAAFDFKKSKVKKQMEENYGKFLSKDVELHVDALWELENMKNGIAAKYPMKPDIFMGLDEVCVQLILHYMRPGEAILVFLPGVGEIQMLYDMLFELERRPEFCPCSFRLFTLSSMLMKEEQLMIADKIPSEDEAHIILATNIAESSLTLPRVRYVIDFGLRRHMVYVPERSMECLLKTWISQASADQRKGRTGRVFEGTVIRLYTRYFYEHCMLQFDRPEMQVAALDRLILQAKQVGCKVTENVGPTKLLSMAISPPDVENVMNAIVSLADSGAITAANENADMTLLAQLVLQMPMDLKLCRLLFFGTIFNCVTDVVVMAAGLSASQDVFSMPTLMLMKKPKEFSESLQWSFRTRCIFDEGQYSEPIMMLSMFKRWITYRCDSLRKKHGQGSKVRKSQATHGKIIHDPVEHAWVQFKQKFAVNEKRLIEMESTVLGLASRLTKLLPAQSDAVIKTKALIAILKPDGKIIRPERKMEGTDFCAKLLSKMKLLDNPPGSSTEVEPGHGMKSSSSSDASVPNDTWMFAQDNILLKIVLTAALTPNILLGTVDGNLKPEKQKRVQDRLEEAGFQPECSVILHDIPSIVRQDPELCKKVLEEMFPPKILAKHHLQKDGRMFLEFPEQRAQNREVVQDIPWSAHLASQFGEGRDKFPCPGLPPNVAAGVSSRISRASHPFRIRWRYQAEELLGGHFKVEGVPKGWRNLVGFACEKRTQITHYAVASEVQGSEDPKKCHMSGVTILPSDCDGLLAIAAILTFLPSRYPLSVNTQFDTERRDSSLIKSVKIMQEDIAISEKHPLTPHLLHLINAVRGEVSGLLMREVEKLPDVNLQHLVNKLVTYILNGEHRKETVRDDSTCSTRRKSKTLEEATLTVSTAAAIQHPWARDSLSSTDSEEEYIDPGTSFGEEIPEVFNYYPEYVVEDWFPFMASCTSAHGHSGRLAGKEEARVSTSTDSSSESSEEEVPPPRKVIRKRKQKLSQHGAQLHSYQSQLDGKCKNKLKCRVDDARLQEYVTDEPLFEDPWDN